MTVPAEGSAAPDIDLPADNGGHVKLSDYAGRRVIVYFYPKDDTSGCTAQSCSFSENLTAFDTLGVSVIGISKDSVKSHDKFKAKYGLTFPLASDEISDVCERYGVWTEKSMYGRKYMGIERTTFLIGTDGKIEKVWNKVKVPGHIEDILSALNDTKKAA